jgi:hypothetical protein
VAEEFEIHPEAVRSAAGNIGGILMQTVTLILDLDRLVVPPTAYAQIGTAVASGDAVLKGQQVTALQSLLKVLQDVNELVKAAADSHQTDDEAVAASLGGGSPPLLGHHLWASPAASQLADFAMADGAHSTTPDRHSVATVLDYMGRVGMGELGTHPIEATRFDTPASFADWLDEDPDNQTRLGVIGIYSGNGQLNDVPGGVHPGDVVSVTRWQLGLDHVPGSDTTVGVVGTDGRLYNHGAIGTDNWHGVTNLRVYRPLSTSL